MLAGDPALDFVNTLHWREDREVDFLPDYRALVEWSVPAALLSAGACQDLLNCASASPDRADEVHRQAINLRATWRSSLDLNAGGNPGSPMESDVLRRELAPIFAISESLLRVEQDGNHMTADFLELPLVRIGIAVASLAMIPAGRRIGRCEGDPCGGYFIDSSRTKPRRWCSMDSCGNRAKVRGHRERLKRAAQAFTCEPAGKAS
ncbi:CGNR zinc finger domain-containing protein [Rhizobium sp. G21]|uniref:CGNR zinc finger domain-containing protein n=1 Tax=Rhizobium sp. G21 TaxID=2758439 RepID=UPI001603747C|nr:CGNR zinc finger domain-containing protein [Rhizobium sp. G21]MBB1250968.1 CGNR zinc finger domain-containing protein [Rhizobium sp. G21]